MKYYLKFLDHDRQPYHGSGQWPEPGVWSETIENPIPCVRGYHLSRLQDILKWCYIPVLWVAEAEDVIVVEDKVVAKRARLIREVEEWNECNQRLFAADCAEHVLKHFEKVSPNDKRPRVAIETARKFAVGQATTEELHAAGLTVDITVYYAEKSAAWSVAQSATMSAFHAAMHAKWSVGTVGSAAGAAERQWQLDTLLTKYLKLNPEEFV